VKEETANGKGSEVPKKEETIILTTTLPSIDEKSKDVCDLFSTTPITVTKPILNPANTVPDLAEEILDDDEGYYRFMPGDVIGNRYQVFANCGRGVFGR